MPHLSRQPVRQVPPRTARTRSSKRCAGSSSTTRRSTAFSAPIASCARWRGRRAIRRCSPSSRAASTTISRSSTSGWQSRPYMLGERPTIADLSLVAYLYYPAEEFGFDIAAEHKNIAAWLDAHQGAAGLEASLRADAGTSAARPIVRCAQRLRSERSCDGRVMRRGRRQAYVAAAGRVLGLLRLIQHTVCRLHRGWRLTTNGVSRGRGMLARVCNARSSPPSSRRRIALAAARPGAGASRAPASSSPDRFNGLAASASGSGGAFGQRLQCSVRASPHISAAHPTISIHGVRGGRVCFPSIFGGLALPGCNSVARRASWLRSQGPRWHSATAGPSARSRSNPRCCSSSSRCAVWIALGARLSN